MKICIPTEDDTGLAGRVAGHFGSAEFLTLIDGGSGGVEVLRQHHVEHGAGACTATDLLQGRQVGVLICQGIGRGAVHRLEDLGIAVLACPGGTVSAALEAYRAGGLRSITSANACQGGTRHGAHG